jgi:transcriptional regulator with XRE-family HTH domain
MNQIVAMNMRLWRRTAGMTQEELGEKLGWSFRAVSAAERTAARTDGKGRLFDAQTLTELALALGVPLIALFLPPEDDRQKQRYLVHSREQDADCLEMSDIMELVVMTDSDDDSGVMAAYRYRLTMAARTYLDPHWVKEVARWLSVIESAEARAIRVEHLRHRRAELLKAADELGDLADAIEEEKAGDS